MSCRWSHQLPHPDDVCLDCEVLAPEKCIEHGPHGEHNLQMKHVENEVYSMWFCRDCGRFLKDDNGQPSVPGPTRTS